VLHNGAVVAVRVAVALCEHRLVLGVAGRVRE
jgi:hypothetical protein